MQNVLEERRRRILSLVAEYITEKHAEKTWTAGEDWVPYSGALYDKEEFVAAFDSLLDEWLTFGGQAREFELRFPEFLGKKFGTLTNSGSSANLLMVSSLKSEALFDFQPGAKIITPVVAFPTTINPIIQNGFEPVFVDSTLPSLNLDLDQVEALLKRDSEIKGLMFAHVLGNPPDMERVMYLVNKYNLVFLEDSCDALGSLYDGKKLGSFGHMSTCSFFPAHHMTMGEGGFVATDGGKIRKTVASLRDWGRACYCNTSKPGDVTSGTACGNRFRAWFEEHEDVIYDHRYIFEEIGFNVKPLEIQAAMGLKQLGKLPKFDAARRKNFARLSRIFEPYGKYLHLPVATPKSDPCWFAYLITVREDAPFSRQDMVDHLEANKIQTRSYFSGNILYHPAYKKLAAKYMPLRENFPVAHTAAKSSFFVGTYAGIDEQKLDYIQDTVETFFDEMICA